jgi:hypothetical protein
MTTQSWPLFLMDWIGLPALALLAGILLYRRWYREFPFFFFYVIAAEVIGLVRLATSSSKIYLQIYWISDALIVALAFLATYELFVKRLFPGFYRIRFYRYLFPVIALLFIFVATFSVLIGGHFSLLNKTIKAYEFLRAAVLFVFVALMLIMGRHWDRQEFGIAFGFGLDISGSLAFIGIWTHSATRSAALGRWSVLAYDIACILWLYCFWPAPKAQWTPKLPPEALDQAKKWEESLKGFIAPGKR